MERSRALKHLSIGALLGWFGNALDMSLAGTVAAHLRCRKEPLFAFEIDKA